MMNDFRFYHKDFLLGFLEIYKCMPSLWQIKHPDYHNRDKKNKDFEILIKKMKEIEPRADRHSLTNKISNLRSVYQRECKRLLKLEPNKKPHELISTNIWYFEHLHFLQDHKPKNSTGKETEAAMVNKTKTIKKTHTKESKKQTQAANGKRKAKPTFGDGDETLAKTVKLQSSSTTEQSSVAVKIENDAKTDVFTANTEQLLKEAEEVLIPELIFKMEPSEEPTSIVEVIDDNGSEERECSDDHSSEIEASTFRSQNSNSDRVERCQNFELIEHRNNFDRFDHMSAAWAGILRSLPRSQQIFAEKLINDVMFEAQLENLSRQSAVVISTESQK